MPDLSCLLAARGKHPQRMFAAALGREAFHTLLNDDSAPLPTRCRIRQASQEGALAFQFAVPSTPDRTLSDRAYLAQWRHSYGLDQPELIPGTRCTYTCTTHGPNAAVDEARWRDGSHLLQCGCSPWRLKRHNGVGRTGLKPIYEESGYVWDERDVHCHVDSGKRVDARCSNSTASHRDDGVDITVGCPACDSYVCDAAVTNADHVTDRLEHGKHGKHAAACDAVGLRFVAAAFTTLGGWGRTARKHLHTLYAKKKKEEKKAGGTGWDTIRWKQDLLERTCVAMAVANFRLLDAHTRAP